MSTRNDRFNASMRSLDEFTGSFDDPTKIAAFSDMGQGVERMLDEIDPVPIAPVAPELHKAEMRLYRAGLGYLVKVLRLIVKKRNNRKESIWELAKK